MPHRVALRRTWITLGAFALCALTTFQYVHACLGTEGILSALTFLPS